MSGKMWHKEKNFTFDFSKGGMAKGEEGKRNKDDVWVVIYRVRMGQGQTLVQVRCQKQAQNKDKTEWWESQTRVQARQNEKNFDTIWKWNPREKSEAGQCLDYSAAAQPLQTPEEHQTQPQTCWTHLHHARRERLSLPMVDRKAWHLNSHLQKSQR